MTASASRSPPLPTVPHVPNADAVPGHLWTIAVGIAAIAVSGWQIHEAPPYTPASGFGYALGLVGGLLMLVLLLYPVRKRIKGMPLLGALRHWFRLHMVAGVLGPLCVVYHSAFHVGSFNAAIALTSMSLVVASGLAGRFIYRKIHHGLFGSKASLQELQSALKQQLETLRPTLNSHPEIQQELEAFLALLARHPASHSQKTLHFISLGWQRLKVARKLRHAVADVVGSPSTQLAETLDAALRAAQKTAQFSTYERLFSLWHVVHIPFLWMLLITAIIHVTAVHAY